MQKYQKGKTLIELAKINLDNNKIKIVKKLLQIIDIVIVN